jgi:hypothetical protein
MPTTMISSVLAAACLLALAGTAAAASRGLQQSSSSCPLPQAVIDKLNFASVNQPCALAPDRDAFCRACICAVGDAIVAGLQAQGLTLERLAQQAQQDFAGQDLPTVARQVRRSGCMWPGERPAVQQVGASDLVAGPPPARPPTPGLPPLQVLTDCQLPVALRVVATSRVDSSAFNQLQLCPAEQVGPRG